MNRWKISRGGDEDSRPPVEVGISSYYEGVYEGVVGKLLSGFNVDERAEVELAVEVVATLYYCQGCGKSEERCGCGDTRELRADRVVALKMPNEEIEEGNTH